MSIKQVSVFVENRQGSLCGITDVLAENGIDMKALTLADTADFGIMRMIVTDTDKAKAVIADKGYLDSCLRFAKKAATDGCIVALRLWNLGTDSDNSESRSRLHAEFAGEWGEVRGGSRQQGTTVPSQSTPIWSRRP